VTSNSTLGAKRTCTNRDCKKRFYDLEQVTPICPECGKPCEKTWSSRRSSRGALKEAKTVDDVLLLPAFDDQLDEDGVADDDVLPIEIDEDDDEGLDVDFGGKTSDDEG